MEKLTLTPQEAVQSYIAASKGKAASPLSGLLIKAVFAGAMIALGAAGSQVGSHAVSNVGLARLIAGAVFPMGLMMVVLTGSELFTGDCLMGMAAVEKQIKVKDMLRVLVLVYLGNFAGGCLVAFLVSLSGQLNYSGGLLGAYSIKTAVGKCSLSFSAGIASGILCNFLVCGAVFLALTAKEVSGKLLSCFFIILLFVCSGYEHCVANMFYIPMGIIAKGNRAYTELAMSTYGLTAEQLASVNIVNMIVKNLIPVTIGNIIGGMFCLGLPIEYVTRNK